MNIRTADIRRFVQALSQHTDAPNTVYLLRGSALVYLNNARQTTDIDIYFRSPEAWQATIDEIASAQGIYADIVELSGFIPLPTNANQRHILVDQVNGIDVCIFDLYSIALSKIERGFDSDIQDILFLLQNNYIARSRLAEHVQDLLSKISGYDISETEVKEHWATLQSLL